MASVQSGFGRFASIRNESGRNHNKPRLRDETLKAAKYKTEIGKAENRNMLGRHILDRFRFLNSAHFD